MSSAHFFVLHLLEILLSFPFLIKHLQVNMLAICVIPVRDHKSAFLQGAFVT